MSDKKNIQGDPSGGVVGRTSVSVKAHLRKLREGAYSVVQRHTRDIEAEQRKEETRVTRRKDIDLWREWKDSGESLDKLEPLLKALDPFIKSRASIHLGRVKMIPDAALMAEYKLNAVEALKSYDPDRGVLLTTHVGNYLQKAKRYVANNQNAGRIPETRVHKIQEFTVARNDLMEELGRAASDKELADKLQWNEAEVSRMDAELRGDLVRQGFEVDPEVITTSLEEEVIRLFAMELDGVEEEVYRHTVGLGRPLLGTGEIAEKLQIENYQVSRIKASLAKRIEKYMAAL